MGLGDPPSGENLLDLSDTSESRTLSEVAERFRNKRIYTNVGDVLLSVNPYEKYSIYDESVIAQYRQISRYAHIFTPARSAVEHIESGSSTEFIVFSGESNSGKSFNAHQVMRYLATSRNSKVTTKHIDAITTIFNSFGCAKTVKNDNATRFGYCMDFFYNKNVLSGLGLSTTLPLETTRVVSQKAGERNFNVFYELCAGIASDARASYGIRDQQKFFYLTQGKVADSVRNDAANFAELDDALEIVGFSDEQRQIIYKTLATILHLGNMYFRQRRNAEDDTEYVEVGNDAELKWASYLLDVDMYSFAPCFTHKFTKTDEGVSRMAYSMGQALDARDSLAMTLYEVMFSWILKRISLHLKCSEHNATISVVDCYGVERYNNNGLEQLLINTVNEKLGNTFVKQTFLEELGDYVSEGLSFDWKMPSYLDNEKVLDLLCKKPYGLLYLIDDECKFPKASDESYLRHCNLNHLDKSIYGKAKDKERLQMSVRHSFGSTWYNVHGFVQRNKRALPGSVAKILAESQNPVIAMLFRPLAGKEGADYVVYSAQQFNTASAALVERILSGQTHFVRCVRSNNERLPAHLDEPTLARQIKNLYIVETLQFRKAGFPVRIPFERFARNYRCLLPSDIALCQNQKEIIDDILDGQGVKFANDYRIGMNYVFMRDRLANRLQTLREKTQRDAAYVIQKTMRAYVARKSYLKKRNAVIRLQAGLRGWKARKECNALRERLFSSLGVQTKRNKRLNAYHESLLTESCDKSSSIPFTAPLIKDKMASTELEKPLHEAKIKSDIKTTTEYLAIGLKSRIHTIEPVPIEKFAENNIRCHLLEPRREPILTPFLLKENDIDFRLSIEIFKLLLKYMSDQTLTRSQLDDLARYIVKQGIANPCQRDEIIVQICNQIYKNRDKEATTRCGRLLLQAVGVFAPSETVLPMLISFANQLNLPLRKQLLSTIARRVNIYDNQHATRLLPASHLEMAAIYGYHNAAIEVTDQQNNVYMVEAHPWITNEEFAARVLRHRGIGDSSGWTIEVEAEKMLYCPTGAHFLFDVISEIELGKEENKRSFFYNYSTERTLPPVNQNKTENIIEPPTRILSPVLKRRMRQMNESLDSLRGDRSLDGLSGGEVPHRRGRSQDSPRLARLPSSPPVQRQAYRAVDEDEDYCYALPIKPKAMNDSPMSNRAVRNPPPDVRPPELPRQPIPNSSMGCYDTPYQPSHPHHRPSDSQDRAQDRPEPMAPNQYYPQAMPMVQYVPVMMAPQSMQMFPTQMSQTMVQSPILMPPQLPTSERIQPPLAFEKVLPPARATSRHSHQREPSSQSYGRSDGEDRNLEYGVSADPRVEFDSIRSRSSDLTRGGISDQVPSVYSTMSVASRIRSMPVPNNNRDVDRFLDEVFDQVLSPHELAAADMNPHQIAATIKGGAYGFDDYDTVKDTAYQKKNTPYPTDYSTDPNMQDGNRYDYITRERLPTREPTRPTERAQSMPRYPAYRHIPHESSDSLPSDVCTMREYVPSPPGTSTIPPSSKFYGRVEETDNVYEPQQMLFMMPMQMSATNGQMMPVLMAPGVMTSSVGPNMMYCMTPTRQTASATRQRRHRSIDTAPLNSHEDDDSVHHHTHHNSSSSSDFHPRNQNPQQFRSMLKPGDLAALKVPRPMPRSPSPAKSPPATTERRPNGLNRVPQDAYRLPAVQSTTINSEHPEPRRLRVPGKNLVKEIQIKEQEALRKINERLKNLPPPVDEVKIYLPKKKTVTPEQVFARVPPEEPHEIVSDFQPDYVVQKEEPQSRWVREEPQTRYVTVTKEEPQTRYIQREEPQSRWVFEGEVERPVERPETMVEEVTRIRSPSIPAPQEPMQMPESSIRSDSVASSERPAVKYLKQPWKLTIRKEVRRARTKSLGGDIFDARSYFKSYDSVMGQIVLREIHCFTHHMFHPKEALDDAQASQLFAQIITDCRKGNAYRIRSYERDQVVEILKASNVPPDMLNRQADIPIDVKIAVIEAARKWPLYFAQFYEVVEEREDESVSVLLAISEHGVKLLLHTPLDKQNPLKSQDYFSFSDLSETTLEGDDVVCLHTQNNGTIRLRDKMAPQIKAQIDKCMFGELQQKQFVRATADYVTKQPNLLSFKKGETIELVAPPNGEVPIPGWFYGKIGNRYGSLPAQYVVPLDDNNREVEESVPPLPLVDENTNTEISSSQLDGNKYTMMEFALNHFRGPKGYESTMRKNKKDWTWQDIAHKIKFTDKPVSHSLIRFDSNELDKLAAETFLCIMKYMGDEPIRRGETLTDAVYRLLLICHKHAPLRDEVYCQIIRQTTNNKSNKPDSSIRGWRLFSILTAYFECSLSLRPYVMKYLTENADDHRRAYHGTAQLCLQNLNQTIRYGGRKYLLSGMEVEEITNGKIHKRQTYFLPGGSKKVVNTKSVTVVEEAIRELCLELNIRSPGEQQEFCLCYVLDKDNQIEYCNNGDYILDICTELERKRVAFDFLLRRCTWVHPLRLDHPVYIDVMYNQVVPDYLDGMFLMRQAAGQISAATVEDISKLAAYIHLADNAARKTGVTPKVMGQLLPAAALEYTSSETWANRVNRQLRTMNYQMTSTQAKAGFLEILSNWQLFGCTVFRLDEATCDGRLVHSTELAIGKNGVKLLEPRSRETLEHWEYDKIVSVKGIGTFVEMVVGTEESNKKYEFHSRKSCSAIVRLVEHYTVIIKESQGTLIDG